MLVLYCRGDNPLAGVDRALVISGSDKRGDGDATMLPEGSLVEENVNLLKEIITAQKKILAEKGLSDKPTMLALYKEVEEYWYVDSETAGLKECIITLIIMVHLHHISGHRLSSCRRFGNR